MLARARKRRFCGLALDGADVRTAIARENDPAVLLQALDIARESIEPIWAERFARRTCELDADRNSRLRAAAFLASQGRLHEVEDVLADMSATVDDDLHRSVLAVLAAKQGRIAEALSIFDTLPGTAPGFHPAAIVLPTAREMVEQCNLAHATVFANALSQRYPDHLVVRSLLVRCNLLAGDFRKARELSAVPEPQLMQAPAFDRRALVEASAEALSW